jgi:guanylate kinase
MIRRQPDTDANRRTGGYRRGRLFVVSAPSGAGKTTLCDRLLTEFQSSLIYSISCTTRAPREGEVDGREYFFLTEESFQRKLDAGEFLEHAQVHGHRYGTLKKFIDRGFSSGRDVLMDLDVQGAAQIRSFIQRAPAGDAIKNAFVDVFIGPPSLEILRKRLEGRGTDAAEVIERRLRQAEAEMAQWDKYRYFILNDRLDASYDALRSIVVAERHRVA